MQTPIVIGPLLWSCDWQGILTCVDRTSGELRYSERLLRAGSAFTASGVAAGGRLYFLNEDGEAFVVAAQPAFSVVARNRMEGLCLATPAAVDGTLFVRTAEKLIAIGTR